MTKGIIELERGHYQLTGQHNVIVVLINEHDKYDKS